MILLLLLISSVNNVGSSHSAGYFTYSYSILERAAVMSIRSLHQNFIVVTALLAFMVSAMVSAQVRNNGIEVVRSSPTEIVISYTPQFEKLDTLITTTGENVYLPRIVGASVRSRQFGSPSILEISAPLAVPSPFGFSISTIQAIGVQ